MRMKRISVPLVNWQYFWVTELGKRFYGNTGAFVAMCLSDWLHMAEERKWVTRDDVNKLLAEYQRQKREKANAGQGVG